MPRLPVTTTADENGTNTSACSLREAIQAANTNAAFGGCPTGVGADTITLPAGLYLLTITTGGGSGDLDLTSNITINGAGPGQTIVDGGALSDRVFDVSSAGNVIISGVTIQHGAVGGDGGGVRNSERSPCVTWSSSRIRPATTAPAS